MINIERVKCIDKVSNYLSRNGSTWGVFNNTKREPLFITLALDNKKSGILNHLDLKDAFLEFQERIRGFSSNSWGCFKFEFNKYGDEWVHFVLGGDETPSIEWLKNAWENENKEGNDAVT